MELLVRGGGFQHIRLNIHQPQLLQGNLPLENVLGLVVNAGFAAPAHHEQAGNAVHLVMEQGAHGVDNVAQTAVLQVYQGGVPRGQVVSGGQAHGAALVGGYHVPLAMHAVQVIEGVAQALELGIRHAGVEGNSRLLAGGQQGNGIHEGSSFCQGWVWESSKTSTSASCSFLP